MNLTYTYSLLIQTEAERRRREAGVKQSMEIRLRSCMWVGGYVWYLELSLEPGPPVRNFDWGDQTFSSGRLPATNAAYFHTFS